MNESTQYATEAISVIRDKTLLLTMANTYLCEDVFLVKIGNEIEKNISRLKDDIVSLKKQFPGKFATEVNTDDILKKMERTANSLSKPEGDIKDACRSGKLGNELESSLKSIVEAVDVIRAQVMGGGAAHSKKGSVSGMFEGFERMGDTLILVGKVVASLVIIAALGFGFLYYTMERESTLEKKIGEIQAYISEREDTLKQLEQKKEEISEEVKEIEGDDTGLGNKIALMDLEVEIQKINQDHHDIEAEIVVQQKKIDEYERRIEEIKEKPFMKRLLRQ